MSAKSFSFLSHAASTWYETYKTLQLDELRHFTYLKCENQELKSEIRELIRDHQINLKNEIINDNVEPAISFIPYVFVNTQENIN